jgi:PAS domain-containing protein
VDEETNDRAATAAPEARPTDATAAGERSAPPSAQLLQRVLDSLVDGVIAVDGGGNVIAANRRIYDLIDVPRGGLRPGISFFDVLLARAQAGAFGPGDPEEQARERVAIKLQPGSKPVRSVGKNKRILEFRRGELGDGGFVAIYTDVTERDRLEQQERSMEQRLREIVEANPLPMTITMVSDGRIVYANEQARTIFFEGQNPAVHYHVPGPFEYIKDVSNPILRLKEVFKVDPVSPDDAHQIPEVGVAD